MNKYRVVTKAGKALDVHGDYIRWFGSNLSVFSTRGETDVCLLTVAEPQAFWDTSSVEYVDNPTLTLRVKTKANASDPYVEEEVDWVAVSAETIEGSDKVKVKFYDNMGNMEVMAASELFVLHPSIVDA